MRNPKQAHGASHVLLSLDNWWRSLPSAVRIPQTELDTGNRGIEVSGIVQGFAVVDAVLPDGVDDQAVSGSAEAQWIAVVEIELYGIQKTRGDQFGQRLGPTLI